MKKKKYKKKYNKMKIQKNYSNWGNEVHAAAAVATAAAAKPQKMLTTMEAVRCGGGGIEKRGLTTRGTKLKKGSGVRLSLTMAAK